MTQRTEIFQISQRALKIMKYIDEKTPRNKVFYAMWLLEHKALNHANLQVRNKEISSSIENLSAQNYSRKNHLSPS